MANLKLHEVEEFTDVMTIPDAGINDEVVSRVRNLREVEELEVFIRQILFDPNETHHGPTEVADILTSRVTIKGEKRLAAFVLKGKSFKTVSSRDVAHQFTRLERIPDLGLMVFAAVGNIQDDAQIDFIQSARNVGCDYIVLDARDIAKLLVAYVKICPKDGSPFDAQGKCEKGHLRDDGIKIEMQVQEKVHFTIYKQRDVSVSAKRYAYTIILDSHYPKDVIREVVYQVTLEAQNSIYHRTDYVKARWGETKANVVWLYVAYSLEDIQAYNWICRSSWIDPNLPRNVSPRPLGDQAEKYKGVEILWNDMYKAHKSWYEGNRGDKASVVEKHRSLIRSVYRIANQAIKEFELFNTVKITEDELIAHIQRLLPEIENLYQESETTQFPPVECKDYVDACRQVYANIHNLTIWFSPKWIKERPSKARNWQFKTDMKRLDDQLMRVKFEDEKLN
jgi:hypothetical protein